MGFIEFTKMAITSLKIGHFHPDFAQLRWPKMATVGLSGGGHCGGQLPCMYSAWVRRGGESSADHVRLIFPPARDRPVYPNRLHAATGGIN